MEKVYQERLQFIRHDEIFETRMEAYDYVLTHQINGDYFPDGDPRRNKPALFGEPMVLLYKNNSRDNDIEGPNVILAIGSVGNGQPDNKNRTFFIDMQKTEEEIEELGIRIEEVAKMTNVIALDSDTIDFTYEKGENGTVFSGDVKLADYRVVDEKLYENMIEVDGNKGLFAFVDMDYDPETSVITFKTTKISKEFQLPKDQHLVKGWYDTKEESLFFKLADDTQIKVPVTRLIEEWTVLGDASSTPIVLNKECVSAITEGHEGIYDWQDILTADVRVGEHITDNILHKDRTGRYLWVKGSADNIKYKDGMTVKDALDNVDTKISTNSGNLIYKRPDGIYASAMLNYNTAENKLSYTYTDGSTGQFNTVEFKLNSVKLLEDITYDQTREVIVIRYIDAEGEYQRVEIPAKDIIEEWEVNNEAHNIELTKYRSEGSGKDVLTADAKIHNGHNNILEDLNHELYVNGISKNIKYDATGNTTVKDVLDDLLDKTEDLENGLNDEITNRESADNDIHDTIGTGFTNDPHENVTYKFEALSAKVDSEIERSTDKDTKLETALQNEVDRSTEKDDEHDEKISDIETIIGSGFTTDAHETVTYKFEQLQNQVNDNGDAIQNEVERSTAKDNEHDEKLQTIEGEIGDGFNPRNTVRDEIDALKTQVSANTDAIQSEVERSTEKDNEHDTKIQTIEDEIGEGFDSRNTVRDEIDALQDEIDALSASTDGKISDIINIDHSIDVDKTNPTEPVISVNLSSEVEDGKPNIIKLNNDGLYAGVDLDYQFNTEVGTNQLIFKTTNGTKTFDLQTNSVVDKIYYDPAREAIIIEYTVNGHRMPDVVVPVADLIDEWRVWDGHEGAIQLEKDRIPSGTTQQDVLKATVVISETHDDNILVNDNGALYVSGQAIQDNADAIAAEVARATAAESALQDEIDTVNTNIQNEIDTVNTSIQDEVTRATNKEQELSDAISTESTRATSAETELRSEIASSVLAEQTRATSAETALRSEIESSVLAEQTRAISAETALQTAINNTNTSLTAEESRAKGVEQTLSGNIQSEITRATNKENALESAISAETAARIAGDDALRAMVNDNDFTLDDSNTVSFDDVLFSSDRIIKASVNLSTSPDNLIIDDASGLFASVDLSYDMARNTLVLSKNGDDKEIALSAGSIIDRAYYDAQTKELVFVVKDASGQSLPDVKIPVSDLFNEWIVQNPSEGSAVELTKVTGRKDSSDNPLPDTLSARVIISPIADNIITLDSNGLYVSGSGTAKVIEDLECIKTELNVTQENVLGVNVPECGMKGDGTPYQYEPNQGTRYISAATSFNSADIILDNKLKEIEDDVNDLMVGSDSPTSHIYVEVDGNNRKLKSDARLSHGNTTGMTDDELIITDVNGGMVEPNVNEFTDTNVLRIIDMDSMVPDAKYNGLYLSNVWDAGKYYQASSEQSEIDDMEAEGYTYLDNALTDEASDAKNYNYMNYVRQHDI